MSDEQPPPKHDTNRDLPLAPETGHPKAHLMRRIGRALDSARTIAPQQVRDVLLLGGRDHYFPMIEHMLTGKRFTCVAATSPAELEEKARMPSAAVALVDSDDTHWSPPADLEIPVIALTEDPSPKAATALRARGFTTVISKPFSPDAFLAVIRPLVETPKAAVK